MKMQIILLLLATLSTGIMAGIFFTWTNAVTPGIGKLSDIDYLNALQKMNHAILNYWFYVLFFGAVLLTPLYVVLYYKSSTDMLFWVLIVAVLLYWLGVFLVTFLGNIPINILLDKTNLGKISISDAQQLRGSIEVKWNNFNLVRTLSAITSFVLLLFVCFQVNK